MTLSALGLGSLIERFINNHFSVSVYLRIYASSTGYKYKAWHTYFNLWGKIALIGSIGAVFDNAFFHVN